MKKYLLTVIVSFTVLLLVSSAKADTKTFDYKDFSSIEIGAGMKLNVTQSENFSVSASGSKKDLEDLDIKTKGSKLSISYKSHGWFSFRHHGTVIFNISMPVISYLDLSGGAEAKLDMKMPSQKFAADLSGGAELRGNLECANIKLEASGGSRAELTGTGKNLYLEGSGGSKLSLRDFAVNDVHIDMSGGTHATVYVNGELDTDQSGGAQLVYYGNASVVKSSFSGGSGMRRGD